MVQLIKPKIPIIEKKDKGNEEESQIPRDPKEVKKYLEIIPEPVGYRMLVRPWSGKKKTKGGLFLSDETHDKIQMTTVVGLVVKMGDLCFKDKAKFPTGAWCSEKSWVLMGRYAGNRFKVENLEVRLINDDNIIATILDPSDISYV